MIQRDIIQKQIQQLGQVIGKMITSLLGSPNGGNIMESIEKGQQAMKTELDIDLNQLIDFDQTTLNHFLKDRHFNDTTADHLGDYYQEWAKQIEAIDTNKAIAILEQALHIYNFAGIDSAVYSMERATKMKAIRNHLDILK